MPSIVCGVTFLQKTSITNEINKGQFQISSFEGAVKAYNDKLLKLKDEINQIIQKIIQTIKPINQKIYLSSLLYIIRIAQSADHYLKNIKSFSKYIMAERKIS